jgi:hypothetical protein
MYLYIANKSDDDWIIITAGIVNNHLFGKSNNDIDNNTLAKISEIANVAIQRIKESTKLSTTQSFYYQPYEYRYLSSELTNGVTNQKSENLNFVFTGHKPDFILRYYLHSLMLLVLILYYYREKLIFEKKSLGDVPKQKMNLGARINTNNNITSSSSNNVQKKSSLNISTSNSNTGLNKASFNKSKMISMESMKALNPSSSSAKKRPNPSTSATAATSEKKAKTEE